MILYNENDFQAILKQLKRCFVLFVVSIVFALISVALFIFLARYETRILFEVLGSLTGVLFAFSSIYFLDRSLFLRRLANEYYTMISSEVREESIVVSTVSKKPITLLGGSKVYEITYDIGEGAVKTIYLSFLFEPRLECGKTYDVVLVSDYIKGFHGQD